MRLKIAASIFLLILFLSSALAENLQIIPDKIENLEIVLGIEGINVYAIMQTGILVGVTSSGLDNLARKGIMSEGIGERREAEQYYLFQINSYDIEKLPDYINVIYYRDGEAIARTNKGIDDRSTMLMEKLTHISFTSKPKISKKSADLSSAIVTDVRIDEIVSQVNQAEYTANIQRLQDFETRYSSTDSCRAAENWAISTFTQLGLETELFPYSYSGQTWHDAIGRHTGAAYPDSIYMLIAHIDATSENPEYSAPGAEDNASGAACILEAARVLSQYDFDCTIEFVLVSGEEQGLYGSEAYAEYCYNSQRNIGGVLNFDMIAYAGGYGWDINIFSDQTFAEEVILADLLASLTDEYSDAYSIRVNTIGPEYGSDHYYFSYYGFPAPFAIDAQLWSAPDWYPWYHTTNDLITNLDLDFATEVVKGTVATVATLVGLWSPPALLFNYPDGLPDLINPSGITSFLVEISPGATNPQGGTAALNYSDADSFISIPITQISPGIYDAVFPSMDCGFEVSFYISAETDEGLVVTDPASAPDFAYSALSATGLTTIFADSFNTNLGWTVQSSCSDGQWQRGIPSGGGERGDPPVDFDGSGFCYVTDNEYGNSDVDGGYTWLISLPIDLSENDAIISYALWYTNNFGDAPNSDVFKVYISNNDGGSWVIVDSIGPHSTPGWNLYSYRIGEFLEPGSLTRIRFEAADLGDGSVVEAGIDAVNIRIINCESEATGIIAGHVTGVEGPIPDVYVNVPGGIVSDSTGDDGYFGLADLAAGIYDVCFYHPEYYDTIITGISVAAGSTTSLDVYLNSLIAGNEYLPGDANMANGAWPPAVIGSDVTYLVNYFRAMPTSPACLISGFYAAADVNASCTVIGSDVTRLVNFFRGLGIIELCPDYPPTWLTPADCPLEAPSGWPNCEEPPLTNKVISGSLNSK